MSEETTGKKISFEFTPIEEKESRIYNKDSKYDPLLNSFLESGHQMVVVPLDHPLLKGKDVDYLRTQIMRRTTSKKHPQFSNLLASVVNKKLYLEIRPTE